MISSSRRGKHRISLVGRADPHIVDRKDPAQSLRLDLLEGSRRLPGCRGERVESSEQAGLLLHRD